MEFFSAPYEIAPSADAERSLSFAAAAVEVAMWADLLSDMRAASAGDSSLERVSWRQRDVFHRTYVTIDAPRQVGALLSIGVDKHASLVRTFLRVVGENGAAIACAMVTRACVDQESNSVPLPSAIASYVDARRAFFEVLTPPAFIERASTPSADALFDAEVRDRGARIARGSTAAPSERPTRRSAIRRTSALALPLPEVAESIMPSVGIAFAFPGEEAYDGALLRELYTSYPYLAPQFDQADAVARRAFRHAFLPLVELETLDLHDQRLQRCPELAHLGVVLCGVIIAETLQDQGVRPDVLFGSGAGELAALTVSGALDLPVALRLAAERAAALGAKGGDVARFEHAVREVRFQRPRVQTLSTVSRSMLGEEIGTYLIAHLSHPGDLAGVTALVRRAGCEHLINCGAGGVLTSGNIHLRESRHRPRTRSSIASGIAAIAASIGSRAKTGATPNKSALSPATSDERTRPPPEETARRESAELRPEV